MSNPQMLKIKLYVDTGFAGAVHEDYEEIDREEWEAMSEKNREKYLEEAAQDFMANRIDFGAYVEE